MNQETQLGIKITTDGRVARTELDGIKRGLDAVKGSATGLKGPLESLGVSFAGLTALGSVAAFAGVISSTVSMAASLKDLSEVTGASVERLSGLSRVAKVSGVDMGLVENALVRLSKALAGGDEEARGAGRALEFLGLKAGELRSLDTADALKVVADRLNQFRDGAGKSALAMDLLGRSGAAALPFLKDLGEEQALVGKITAEQALAADALEKDIRRLNASFGELSKQLAMDAVPQLKVFTEQLLEGRKIAGGWMAAMWEFGVKLDPLKSVSTNLTETRVELERLTKAMEAGRRQNMSDGGQTDLSDIESQQRAMQKRLEFLKLLQRQAVEAAYPDGKYLDARDLAARQKYALDYTSKAAKDAVSDSVKAYDALMKSIREKIALEQADLANEGKLSESQKLNVELTARRAELLGKITPLAAAELQTAIQLAVTRAQEIEERDKLNKLLEGADERRVKAIDGLAKEAQALEDETQKIRDQNVELIGGKEALEAITVARLDDAIAARQRKLDLIDESSAEAAGIRKVIDALKDRQVALGEQITAQNLHKQQEEWKRFTDDIERSLTDALMAGFEAGKGAGQSFVDSLKHALETAALKIVVQAIVSQVTGAVGSALGITGAAGSTGNLLSGVSGVSNLFGGGGMYNAFANSSWGTSLGLSTGLGSTAISTGLEIGGLGTGGSAVAGGLTSLGSAIPYVGAALAIGSALGLFGDDDGNSDNYYRFSGLGAGSTVDRSGFHGQKFDFFGAGGSTYSALPGDTQAAFDAAIGKLYTSFDALAVKAGLSATALDAVSVTVGSHGASIQDDIQAALQAAGDALTAALWPDVVKFQESGKSLTETLQDNLTALDAFNASLATLHKQFSDFNAQLDLGSGSILDPLSKYRTAKDLYTTAVGGTDSAAAISAAKDFLQISRDVFGSTTSYASDYGAVKDALAALEASLGASAQDSMPASLKSLQALLPSHASGLAAVPFDGYMATLHRDEAVVDAGTMASLRRYGIAANDNQSHAAASVRVQQAGFQLLADKLDALEARLSDIERTTRLAALAA